LLLFQCQHCDKVFPVFADLETHTKEHSKKKVWINIVLIY